MSGNDTPELGGVLLLERREETTDHVAEAAEAVSPPIVDALPDASPAPKSMGIGWYGRPPRRKGVARTASTVPRMPRVVVAPVERADSQEALVDDSELMHSSWDTTAALGDQAVHAAEVTLDPAVDLKQRYDAQTEELTALWERGVSIFHPDRLTWHASRAALQAEAAHHGVVLP